MPEPAEAPRREILVGLDVADDDAYARYRARMTPLLEARGGCFRLDLRVGELLAGPEGINRVFIISFPDEQAMRAFFDDPGYARIRVEHFDPAVRATHILGTVSA